MCYLYIWRSFTVSETFCSGETMQPGIDLKAVVDRFVSKRMSVSQGGTLRLPNTEGTCTGILMNGPYNVDVYVMEKGKTLPTIYTLSHVAVTEDTICGNDTAYQTTAARGFQIMPEPPAPKKPRIQHRISGKARFRRPAIVTKL